MTNNFEDAQDLLIEAAKYLRAAMTLLDEAQAPGHIAAHVDLAVNQIADVIALQPRVRGPDGSGDGRAARVM
jgi:hypothetical protein